MLKKLRRTLQFICGKDSSKFVIDGIEYKIDPKESTVVFTIYDIKVRLQRSDIAAIEEALLDNRKPTKDQQESLKLARKVDMEALSDVEVIRAYINHLGSPIWRQAGNSILRGALCPVAFAVAIFNHQKSVNFPLSLLSSDLAFLLGDYLLCELFSPKHLQNLESTHLLPLLYDRLSDMPEAFYNKYPVEKLDAALQNLKDNKLQDYLFERWQKTTSFWTSALFSIALYNCILVNWHVLHHYYGGPIDSFLFLQFLPFLFYLLCNLDSNVYEYWDLIVVIGSILFTVFTVFSAAAPPGPSARALIIVISSLTFLKSAWPIFQYDQFIRKEGAERLGKLAPILRMAYANPEKWKDVEMENAGAISEPTIKIEEDPTMEPGGMEHAPVDLKV